MTFCGTPTIGQLVRGKAREQEFWVWRLGWVALLWDLQVAEATEDKLAGASGGFVVGERGDGGKFEATEVASLGCVVDGVMLMEAERSVSSESVMRAVPMVLEC